MAVGAACAGGGDKASCARLRNSTLSILGILGGVFLAWFLSHVKKANFFRTQVIQLKCQPHVLVGL